MPLCLNEGEAISPINFSPMEKSTGQKIMQNCFQFEMQSSVCTYPLVSKFQIIFLYMQHENSNWKSSILFNANFAVRNLQLSVGKLQLPGPNFFSPRCLWSYHSILTALCDQQVVLPMLCPFCQTLLLFLSKTKLQVPLSPQCPAKLLLICDILYVKTAFCSNNKTWQMLLY